VPTSPPQPLELVALAAFPVGFFVRQTWIFIEVLCPVTAIIITICCDRTQHNIRDTDKMGLRSMFGCNYEAVALYRISLGVMLLFELVTRFNYLHAFYSDEGTLPLRLLRPKIDIVYKIVCVHCYSGSMIYMQLLLSIQVLLAAMLIVGYRTKVASIASWFLYLSLTLRNTWLNFILDSQF